jgi:hypothetical protein
VGIVGEDITCNEYAQILSGVLGKPIKYRHIPAKSLQLLVFPEAKQ